MRDRLTEIIGRWDSTEPLVDHLLENGVIVPPCKVGDVVYSKKGNPYVVEGIHYKNGRFLFGGSRDGIEECHKKSGLKMKSAKQYFSQKKKPRKH